MKSFKAYLEFIPFIALLLAGCVTTADSASVSGLYFGAVYISKSESEKNSSELIDVKTLGLWSDHSQNTQSIGTGWKRSKALAVGSKCQIIFIVENAVTTEQVLELISSSNRGSDKICIEKL